MMAPLATPFPCPSCSTSLVFRTDISLSQVCPACQAIVRRAELDGAPVSKAKLPREVMSIIQVGVTGAYANEAFEVIGRIQYFFSEGYRNHWFLLYSSGKTGWLGDWAGNYSLFQESTYTGLAPVTSHAIGDNLNLGSVSLQIEVIDRVKSYYWEGEVPEKGLLEQGFTSIDLFNTKGQMGIIHTSGVDVPHACLGKYVELKDVSLQGTRVHHEWL